MQQYLSIFLFFLPLEIFANQISLDIANALKKASLQSGIDKKMLYTLAKIESDLIRILLLLLVKRNLILLKKLRKKFILKISPIKTNISCKLEPIRRI